MKVNSVSGSCVALAAVLVAVVAVSQTRQIRRNEADPQGQKRVALIIGNNDYLKSPLRNALNDARTVGRQLGELGFQIEVVENTGRKELALAVDRFVSRVQAGDVALFYYSGHGVQVNGENYLMPVDYQERTETDVKYDAYPLGKLQDLLEGTGARLKILVLDACRDNPYRSARSGAGGLAQMQAGTETLISFATAPGQTADDNPADTNGIYTKYLLEVLRQEGLRLGEVFDRTREKVYAASRQKQLPWTSSSVIGDFYFRAGSPSPGTPPAAAPSGTPDLHFQAEIAFWNAVGKDSTESLKLYLEKYPKGQFAELARLNLGRIQKQSPSGAGQGPQQIASASIPPLPPGARPGISELKSVIQGVKFEFVQISPGTFAMGSDQGYNYEKPPHRVTISRGFQMGKYEVTQAQWQAVMGSNPSEFTNCGLDCPVEQVSWLDVVQFLGRLNGPGDGYVYRLPTEAEWEYAARAGTTGDYGGSGNVDEMGWFDRNSGEKTHPVGGKNPNAWGLHDMHGNVWEWVADWYDGNYYRNSPTTDPRGPNNGKERVLRGGSWNDNARSLRSADRDGYNPDDRDAINGFRLVRLAARTSR